MNSLEIEVNGVFLDLGDRGLRYELVNPLFNAEVYQGEYSFPGKLPLTDKNKITLGFVHLAETQIRVLEYRCVAYFFGVPKINNKLTIKKVTQDGIHFVLNGGIKSLSCANKKLSELDLGADYDLGNNQATVLAKAKLAAEEGNWQTYGFTFVPFSQPDFYDGKNPSFNGVANRVNCTNGDILGNSLTVINNQYTLVPWLFLYYVLNRIWLTENLVPSGSAWTHPELSKLLLTNSRSVEIRPNDNNTKVINTGIQNFNADGQVVAFSSIEAGSYDNLIAWDNATHEYIIKKAGTHVFTFKFQAKVDSTSGTPPFNLDPGKFNIKYDGVIQATVSPTQDPYKIYVKSITITTTVPDIGKAVKVDFTAATGLFQGQTYTEIKSICELQVTLEEALQPAAAATYLQYKNHVSEMTVSELLASIKQYGINFDFNFRNGFVKIDIADKLLESTEEVNITGKSEKAFEMSFEESGAGFKVGYDLPDADTAVIDPEKFVGEFDEVESSNFPTPVTEGTYGILAASNQVFMVVKNGASVNEWQYVGHNYPPFTMGRGEKEIKIKIPPVGMAIFQNEYGTSDENLALMPWITGPGSSELYGLGIKEVTHRLAFWRGYNVPGVDSPKGGKYILANTDIYGINKNKVGDISFRLDRPENIVKSLSKNLLNILTKSELMEVIFYMQAGEFERIKNETRLSYNFNSFLIMSLSISINKSYAIVKGNLIKG